MKKNLTSNNKIFILDDNPDRITILSSLLSNDGYELVSSTNSLTALEQIQNDRIDLVILDVRMPEIDGFEFCAQLKKTELTKDIPVIFISSLSDTQNKLQAFKLGADDYITYPFEPPEVTARVQSHLRIHQLQHELAANNQALVEKNLTVEKINKQLVLEKEKAEKATRLKSQFVSLVAHDLRSPLATIIGYLGLLRMDAEQGNALNISSVDIMVDVSNKMTKVIDDILDIERLQSGMIHLKKTLFEVKSLVDDEVYLLKQLRAKKNLTINIDISSKSRIYADRSLYQQVIQNLLTNAIKFSYPDGCIRIFQPANDPGSLVVQDSGVGIDPKTIQHLFSLGKNISQRGTNNEMGTGFGLPYSADIMLAHGGNISADAKPGEGAIFKASLPISKPFLMIVGDMTEDRKSIIEKLSQLYIDTIEATTEKLAHVFLNKYKIDLIIFDTDMTDTYGVDFKEKLNKIAETKGVPVVLCASDEIIETAECAFRFGTEDIISEPFMENDILASI